MLKILSQPFPRETTFRKQFLNAVVSGIIVAFFLRLFSPFGFNNAPVNDLNLFALGYGLVTAIIVILFAVFEYLFPGLFIEEKWTIGKNVLIYILIIFFIGAGNFLYTVYFAGMPFSIAAFINFQLFTLLVTFFVVSALTMIKYLRSIKINTTDAAKIENEIRNIDSHLDKKNIILKSDNEKENIQLSAEELLYIESADNYCRIYYLRNGKVGSTMLRGALKRFEEEIAMPEFFRCHRTFLVNLRNIERVSGNSQGYRLHFNNHSETIPVSRRTSQELEHRLKTLSSAIK